VFDIQQIPSQSYIKHIPKMIAAIADSIVGARSLGLSLARSGAAFDPFPDDPDDPDDDPF
jgi:hypothetical protein